MARARAAMAVFLAYMMAVWPVMAQGGGIITNGSTSKPDFLVPLPGFPLAIPPSKPNAFLFEPEFPLNSLKSVPTWNELEQLLDNPYAVALCSSLTSAPPLDQNTPGTTQITGSPVTPIWPAYCSTVTRRPSFLGGGTLFTPGTPLPPLLVHPLNYNPTTGEEMRLLNDGFPGAGWKVPDKLVQSPGTTINPRGQTVGIWNWTYRNVQISPGRGRVLETEIDYNAPIASDNLNSCLFTTEAVPPEGSRICGGDPGEPNYGGFGVLRRDGYSTPAVQGVTSPDTPIPASARLYDPTRSPSVIAPRNPTNGNGGLRKPSIRVPPLGNPNVPGYIHNTDPNNVNPSNENDYVTNRQIAAVLGKSLFWDMQVGSDAVQACGSCHAHAGADNRTKNQMNPNHIGGDLNFEVRRPNDSLLASDFPIHKLMDPFIVGDPKCSPAITATIDAGVLENNLRQGGTVTVCDASNVVRDKNNAGKEVANDVASSMGVHFGKFYDIPVPGPLAFGPPSNGVSSVLPDLRSPNPFDNIDPIPGFAGITGNDFRRVEPRNTPTLFAAALNFDNFWDGRARHDFQGGSVFGAADPQKHVFVSNGTIGGLTATRQIIRFVSLASLATGPALSEFEMSFLGRNWAKIGKKLLQAGVTPLANQLVDPTDSVLGPYSNQGGSACGSLAAADRSPGTPAPGKPGLCISYPGLIRNAFYRQLWQNQDTHLNGCYTGSLAVGPASPRRPVCPPGTFDDPFDHYVLTPAPAAASPIDTNQFTQMEANFSLFWGLSIHVWGTLLMPDNTPFDQFLEQNPDQFESIGEVGEPGLTGPLPVCTSPTQRHCFREVGNFKRDSIFADPNTNNCMFPHPGEGIITSTLVSIAPCKGTRTPGQPDPLLGMDIFQGSNVSLKNPNFRAARCGECHAGGTLTDNTMPFTFKAQLGDFIGEFLSIGNEALIEPLGRTRVITGFLLESEMNENGQDAIERRIINQSVAPNPVDGLAYPDGLSNPPTFVGAGQSLFDNGVYNLGVTRCEANQTAVTGACDDVGRGGTDSFGWPLSLATLLLKNVGGDDGNPCVDAAHCSTEPGVPLVTFDPSLGNGGGLFEETGQDQQLNPGESDEILNPLLPPYLYPWANNIPVGDTQPELDEIHAGLNTLTDVAVLEGFIDVQGPFNPAGVLNESMNNGEAPEMGTWPVPNRVGRFGSIKAPQLREVELTGPYFHNGGKLTLRQVVDFYVRGGDFPATNATHRDFNIINLNFEVQSNLTEEEQVALVDFMLELTDDRVRFEQGPFDHPQVILPLDGTAPENTLGRDAMLAGCVSTPASVALGPGQRECARGMFLDVPAVGAGGNPPTAPLPNFLGISSGPRLVGAAAFCGPGANNHYCH